MMNIENTLKSTYTLIKNTFQDAIGEEEYYIILYLFNEYMSDENLAKVMSALTNKSIWVIENDIAKVLYMHFPKQMLNDVQNRLNAHGFREWKEEE